MAAFLGTGAGATVVVVRTKVVETGSRVCQEVPDDHEFAPADRDDGLLLAASSGDASVAGAEEGGVLAALTALLPRARARPRLPWPVAPLPLVFPALLLTPGANLAQEARWPGVGNPVMSAPISAMMTAAMSWPIPEISLRRSTL